MTVTLTPRSLKVVAAGDMLLGGDLAAEVKVEESTWYCGKQLVSFSLCRLLGYAEDDHRHTQLRSYPA